MIMNRLVDWDAVYRAAQAMYAGQAKSPYLQDPTKLTDNAAANRQLLYPGGTATNPRSNALTPGVFAPGAGYVAGPGMMAAPAGASAAAVPSSTLTPPAPLGVQGYQTIKAAEPPQASGAAMSSGLPSGGATATATPATGGQPSGTAASGGQPSSERPGWQNGFPTDPSVGYAAHSSGKNSPVYTGMQPVQDGMITFSKNMPNAPGETFTGPGGVYLGTYEQRMAAEKNAPKGKWEYLGPDVSQYGMTETDSGRMDPNRAGAWKWVEAPTAKSLPGLREMLLEMFGGGQQVPSNMPTAPSGGLLPNDGGMAPGGLATDPAIAADVGSMFRV